MLIRRKPRLERPASLSCSSFLIATGFPLGCSGDLLGLQSLRGFGAATHLALAMKVFTRSSGATDACARFYTRLARWLDAVEQG
ncbi:MAG: hypothetical protein IPO66_19185 [Rhodanobacteraceae bacterium]|nr:hypothetical protein [Rhodanobacteraceae bacterium]